MEEKASQAPGYDSTVGGDRTMSHVVRQLYRKFKSSWPLASAAARSVMDFRLPYNINDLSLETLMAKFRSALWSYNDPSSLKTCQRLDLSCYIP